MLLSCLLLPALMIKLRDRGLIASITARIATLKEELKQAQEKAELARTLNFFSFLIDYFFCNFFKFFLFLLFFCLLLILIF
jgi:hypothetical protein